MSWAEDPYFLAEIFPEYRTQLMEVARVEFEYMMATIAAIERSLDRRPKRGK